MTTIRSPTRETSEFPILVRLYMGLALSPYLFFPLVMDELIRLNRIMFHGLCCLQMLLLLVEETKRGVNVRSIGVKMVQSKY